MIVISFFILHWYVSLFFQTFFHHRYAAHNQFTMSFVWERIFHLLSFISQGSSYLSPYAYAVLHRMHHAHADTELDPHSPKYDPSLMAMMLRTRRIYSDIAEDRANVDEVYKKRLPQWKALDRFADFWLVRVSWVAAYTVFYAFFATHWWMYALLPLHFIMGPLHGAIINWFAHKYGYINYKTQDTSHNLMPIDIIMLGEGFHNNHHKFQRSPNFGKKWYEIDPVYPIILGMNKLGILKMKRAES